MKFSTFSVVILAALMFAGMSVAAQTSAGPAHGTLVVSGGDYEAGVKEFVTLAGGPDANFVYIPTAASSIRLPSGFIWEPPDTDTMPANTKEFVEELAHLFGVRKITLLHSRSRATAQSSQFVEALKHANGVWLGAGNAGRLIDAYLDTRTQRELEAVLSRGGIIGGNSAGAIIQGSYTVRGRPDKPVLMVKGRERGFSFLKNVAVNPHLTEAKRESELVTVIDAHPKLLGIGIDEKAAMIVKGDRFEVIGSGRVAVYDNQRHGGSWYYYLKPGDVFNLRTRKTETQTK